MTIEDVRDLAKAVDRTNILYLHREAWEDLVKEVKESSPVPDDVCPSVHRGILWAVEISGLQVREDPLFKEGALE
jgi:hypothetical protein